MADHIDSIVDNAKNHSTTGMKSWSEPNADDVRGQLRTWQTKCGTVAKALREEVQKCTQDAKDLQDKKN
ncbi:hypothetical protein ACIF9R_29395 [Streptomyces sp. NPDC086080]|uniref:hypothetical protein n=1 Tax=Streptomyces sp. NPDC086080 TaxID=3365748 RepID=UPI0037D6E885